jgi:hypothetical protein
MTTTPAHNRTDRAISLESILAAGQRVYQAYQLAPLTGKSSCRAGFTEYNARLRIS